MTCRKVPGVVAKGKGFSVNRLEKHDFLNVDRICTEFESAWNPDRSLADFGSYLLAMSQPTSPEFIELFCELAQIDIERRWKHFADCVNQSPIEEAEPQQEAISAIPRYMDYLKAVNLIDCDSRAFISDVLAKCELRTRCKFGDVPYPAEYGLPTETGKLENFLPVVTINNSSGTIYKTSFYSPLNVGRQDVDEPEPLGLLWRGSNLKLVCTRLDDKSISRQQFTIRIIAGKQVQLENHSRNRWFVAARDIQVAPQSSVALHLPITVDLDSLSLCFRRPMHE